MRANENQPMLQQVFLRLGLRSYVENLSILTFSKFDKRNIFRWVFKTSEEPNWDEITPIQRGFSHFWTMSAQELSLFHE